jgi:hypothetical protein
MADPEKETDGKPLVSHNPRRFEEQITRARASSPEGFQSGYDPWGF